MIDYFEILNIKKTDNLNEIEANFKSLSKKYYYNSKNDELARKKIIQLNEAFCVLRDNQGRKFLKVTIEKNVTDNNNPYYKYLTYLVHCGHNAGLATLNMNEKEFKKSIKFSKNSSGVGGLGELFLVILDIFSKIFF